MTDGTSQRFPWPENLLRRLVFHPPTTLPTGCITYEGARDPSGYGRILSGKLAHRVAYEWLVGPIPDGLHIDHLCHTHDLACNLTTACPHRRCVRPSHMEPVEPAENTRRGRTPNGGKPTCKRGHPWTPENTLIRADGYKKCRACARIRSVGERARAKAKKIA